MRCRSRQSLDKRRREDCRPGVRRAKVSLKSLRKASLEAALGTIKDGLALLAISPSRRVPLPYLAPYGYLAVNDARVATHSGRNVASMSRSSGKAKAEKYRIPSLDKGMWHS